MKIPHIGGVSPDRGPPRQRTSANPSNTGLANLHPDMITPRHRDYLSNDLAFIESEYQL
jgi:hypothetical protein